MLQHRLARLLLVLYFALASCGTHGNYTSSNGLEYYWEGGTFAPADIKAVEAALVARGLCRRVPAVSVRVYPEAFRCRSSRSGRCNGETLGSELRVVGEPWRCAGEGALLHELFHACGPMDHGDARWPLANQPVICMENP